MGIVYQSITFYTEVRILAHSGESLKSNAHCKTKERDYEELILIPDINFIPNCKVIQSQTIFRHGTQFFRGCGYLRM